MFIDCAEGSADVCPGPALGAAASSRDLNLIRHSSDDEDEISYDMHCCIWTVETAQTGAMESSYEQRKQKEVKVHKTTRYPTTVMIR